MTLILHHEMCNDWRRDGRAFFKLGGNVVLIKYHISRSCTSKSQDHEVSMLYGLPAMMHNLQLQ